MQSGRAIPRAIALKMQEVRAKPAKRAKVTERGLIQPIDQPLAVFIFSQDHLPSWHYLGGFGDLGASPS
jgi:hypothetical protein